MELENKSTKADRELLVAYDVRGIQDYIFRTNRVVEVMGASRLVEDIIPRALKEAVKSLSLKNEERVLLDWEDDHKGGLDEQILRFEKDKGVLIQVLYIGGGNAYVLFRNRELNKEEEESNFPRKYPDICSMINRRMARYILDKTYSLQLAVASVPYTGAYDKDIEHVLRKMAEVKGSSPVSHPAGALPIMEIETATGFPAVKIDSQYGRREPISRETLLKRESKKDSVGKEGEERELDALVTKKGIDSMIAIVHIDGNNMGSRIKVLMEGHTEYTSAINRIREISMRINKSFKETMEATRRMVETASGKHPAFANKEKLVFIRPLLTAGDDITFICNASVALTAVEFFCRDISYKVLYEEKAIGGSQEEQRIDNIKKYGFSVCAGIAFMNSHFPFRVGYQVAEQCCDDYAKKRAKEPAYQDKITVELIKGRPKQLIRTGSWVDYQICRNVQAAQKTFREDEYELFDGSVLTLHPYYISAIDGDRLNDLCKGYDFSIFKENYKYFSSRAEIPRTLAQRIKDAYSMGEHEVKAVKMFAVSRKKSFPLRYQEAFRKKVYEMNGEKKNKKEAMWFDALELLDYYVELKEERCEDKESNA